VAPAETLLDVHTAQRAVTHVMGGSAHLTVVARRAETLADLDGVLVRAEQRLRQLEARWSRFVSGSEISALNHARGTQLRVSPDTVALVRAMVSAWRLTDGIVDAALLREVLAAGYERSVLDPSALTIVPAESPTRASFEAITIDADVDGGVVRLPRGLALDPGGIGKGLAADLIVEELAAAGADGALIEIGGDVRVFGASPSGAGWFVDIDDPHTDGGVVDRAGVVDGGIATSSVMKRRWIGPDGLVRHHLIGRDGYPAHHGLATSTAVVGTAALAEVMAKIPLLIGEDDGLAMLDAWQVPALVVRHDRTVVCTRFWSEVAA
jgi:thiamine biosynthesis lipoprotein